MIGAVDTPRAEETNQPDIAERMTERRRVSVRSGAHERDARELQDAAGHRNTAVPWGDSVKPTESPLDRLQQRRRYQRT